MSQGYASARSFPDPPPLSAENPGRLLPARIGSLPGALPGRGGREDAATTTAPIRKQIRETAPASAANLPAHLVNGLPFQRGSTPVPGSLNASDTPPDGTPPVHTSEPPF